MREGSLSWLYTAWLIVILLAVNDVKSASAGVNSTSVPPKNTTAKPTTAKSTTAKTTTAKPTTAKTTTAKPTTAKPTTTVTPTTVTTTESPPAEVTIEKVEALNSTSLHITWAALSSAIGSYTVCYSSSPQVDCSGSKTVDGSTTNTIITELDEFTTYYVAVKASSTSGVDGPLGAEKTGTTAEDKPSRGPNIKITDVTATSMMITWEALTGDDANGVITNYTVCYLASDTSTDIDCYLNKTVDGDETEVVLDGLNEATTYYIAVKAGTSRGFGKLGKIMTRKTLEDKPESGPNITRIIATTSKSIHVSWGNISADDANGIITNYYVCYKVQSSEVDICSVNKTVEDVHTRKTVLDNLNEFTTYAVAIRAATSEGPGPIGETESNTTFPDRPAKGPNITGITTNSTALGITWQRLNADDSNGMITKYEVCYQNGSANPNCDTSKEITDVNSTMIYITGLIPNKMYRVAVRAFTEVGAGPLGRNESVKTNESVPASGPNIITLNATSSTSIYVSWGEIPAKDTNGNITHYFVCYKVKSSRNDICSVNRRVNGTNNKSTVLNKLNEFTTYEVAIQAATSKGAGKHGEIKTNTTLQDVPAKGPTITSITPTANSLKLTWNELSADDSNGKITEYEVCYQVASTVPVPDCSSSKTVTGVNNTMVNLTGLKPATMYTVAVRAFTKIGPGPLGDPRSQTTNESSPGAPIIQSSTATFSTISPRWSEPLQPNGVILRYQVCWRLTDGGSDVCRDVNRSIPSTAYQIPGLKPGTSYTVSVRAFTKAGKGESDTRRLHTTKSALEDTAKLSSAGVSDDKTQIGFKLPSIPLKEQENIKYFYVIVKQWPGNENKEELRAFPQNKLTNFQNSNSGEKEYIAIRQNGYKNDDTIIVGNNTVTAARRKRRNTVEYKNGPLSEDTTYAIFIRTFYDKNEKSFQSSDIFIKKTEKTEDPGDGTDTALIVIVVVVIIVAILVVIFGVLLVRRRKSQPEYDGMPLTTPAKPVIRYPIPIAEFRAHCDRLGVHQGLGYQEEYENVRPNGQVTTETAKRQENVDKNRYNNIHAYDDTRVILSQLEGEEGSDYINANHIDGFERKNQFIAAQGALKTTIVDFWRMIWEQKVSSIVMVANPIEKGREKLAVYWPQDRAVKHGPFMIKLDGEVELADYVIRKMTVTQDDVKETRQITQFHYTVWPDHGVPLYTTSLQAFLTRIRKFVKDESHPVVVHCSAGVGRTGTFIGIFAMLDMIEATKTVDIFNFVCQMRTQRTHMVQVESQYVFLHKAVLEAIECGDTEINAPDLRVKMIQFNRNDPDNPDETLMAKQFKVLEKYTYIKSNNEEGKKSYNVDKNRSKDILPYEDTRVALLKSPGVDGSDYINASCIDSYQVRGMYIATQFPLESTVNEFWRMIWEKKSNCIIMLADTEENPELFKKYWTDKSNDAMLCGNLLVTLDNEEKNDEFVVRNFKLKKNEGGETRDIWHFNFLSWTEDTVPKTTVGIRQMIGKMQEVQRQVGNNPIVVHCSDGSGRTGAFCALVTSLERVKQDQSFNLFQTIMLQRIQRPRMVASVEQYKFCFQAILDFLDSFDQYANFQDLRQ